MPDGERAGFFIGDGAGVGKGRQIAGVILDNLARGRRCVLGTVVVCTHLAPRLWDRGIWLDIAAAT